MSAESNLSACQHISDTQEIRKLKYRLFLAIKQGKLKDITKVLESHPDMINERINNFDWSALQVAAFFGHEDIVRILLEKGADIDHMNLNG